jgi:hypothetical protein
VQEEAPLHQVMVKGPADASRALVRNSKILHWSLIVIDRCREGEEVLKCVCVYEGLRLEVRIAVAVAVVLLALVGILWACVELFYMP